MRESRTEARIRRTDSITAVLPWLDDQEEAKNRRALRVGLTLAAAVHVLALSLPLIAPKPLPPRVIDLRPIFRIAETPIPKPTEPPAQPPEPPTTPPRTATVVIPVPTLPDPLPIDRPLESITPEPTLPTLSTVLDLVPLPDAPPADPDEVLEFGVGMTKPVRIGGADPVYTEAARKVGIQGIVIVEATIDRDGRVVEASVLRGLPFGLSESALAAVESWSFEPSTLNGKSINVRYRVVVNYFLAR